MSDLVQKQRDRELQMLNHEVEAVLARRKHWMDAQMANYAKYQIGEEVFDRDTGKRLGTISKHYRYWDQQHNPLYDDSMAVEYEYCTGNNIFDNTSRHGGALRICNAKELEDEMSWRMRKCPTSANYEKIFGK